MSQRVSCPHCGDEFKLSCEQHRLQFEKHKEACRSDDVDSTVDELAERLEALEAWARSKGFGREYPVELLLAERDDD